MARRACLGGGVNDLIAVQNNLTLDGILNINAIAGFGHGPYELFSYGGLLTNNGLTFGPVPAGLGLKIDTSIAGEVLLVVTPEPSALLLAGCGIAGLAVGLRRRKLY